MYGSVSVLRRIVCMTHSEKLEKNYKLEKSLALRVIKDYPNVATIAFVLLNSSLMTDCVEFK